MTQNDCLLISLIILTSEPFTLRFSSLVAFAKLVLLVTISKLHL